MDKSLRPIHPDQDKSYDPAIRIVEHDPMWRENFEREAKEIQRVLGSVAVRVDHVGSTSVEGLAAKPIIDISVSVNDISAIEMNSDNHSCRPVASLENVTVVEGILIDAHGFDVPRTHLPRLAVFA